MAELTPKHYKAIEALLSEDTIANAANNAGIGERTLYRWLDDPVFAASYRAARRQVTEQGLAQLQGACGKAASTLIEVMNDSEAPASIRLRAAQSILDAAMKWTELDDLAARLESLEAAIDNQA